MDYEVGFKIFILSFSGCNVCPQSPMWAGGEDSQAETPQDSLDCSPSQPHPTDQWTIFYILFLFKSSCYWGKLWWLVGDRVVSWSIFYCIRFQGGEHLSYASIFTTYFEKISRVWIFLWCIFPWFSDLIFPISSNQDNNNCKMV